MSRSAMSSLASSVMVAGSIMLALTGCRVPATIDSPGGGDEASVAATSGSKQRSNTEKDPKAESSRIPAQRWAPRSPPSPSLTAGLPAWAARGQGKPKALEAIAAWEQAMGCQAGDTPPDTRCSTPPSTLDAVETLAMLTRAHYFVADAHLRSQDTAYLDFMDRALWWGERALLAASPKFAQQMRAKAKFAEAIEVAGIDAVPAMYWYALALREWATRSGFAVFVGQKDNINALAAQLIAVDPGYYFAGPHRYAADFCALAPAFAGGDVKLAEQTYEEVLLAAPEFLGTKVQMAKYLATKLDDGQLFDRLLRAVVDADLSAVPAEIRPEAAVEQDKARELRGERDDWF